MSRIADNFLYIFFYVFPILMLFIGGKFRPNFDIFPIPFKVVDFLTPYLLLSVFIQTNLAGFNTVHFYFYILLSVIGIIHASYLAFGKRSLLVGRFFRTWWRYVFIFAFFYHFIIGGYSIYLHFFA